MSDKKILFLLINYFNEIEVVEFVSKQLGKFLGNNVSAIIVNNGSYIHSNVFDGLENKFENLKIIRAENNLGYFGGANLGLNYYLKHHTNYADATIICNTDITLENTDFIHDLNNVIETKKFDVLGPEIYSTSLKYQQNPYIIKRITAKRIKLYHFFTRNTFLYSLLTFLQRKKIKNKKINIQNNASAITYAIHGSFMVFNKSYFLKGGTLDYPSFLFGEELFVAETALQLGLKTIYEPSLKIKHFQNSTTGKYKSTQAVKYLHQSYSFLLQTFFNTNKK